jgi:PIN domain nuclease of toxin-antitoxin system
MQLNPLIITTKSAITAAAAALLIALSSAFELATPARPSYIRLDDVSQQYPVTLMDVSFYILLY